MTSTIATIIRIRLNSSFMADLWTILIPIVIADIINPVLFGFMVYAVGSSRPVGNSLMALLGHTTAYFSAGIVLALGMECITAYLSAPSLVDYLIEILIGLLLLWVAFLSSRKPAETEKGRTSQLTPVTAFGFGAIINFIGIPFALPYFAAIDQILKEDLSATNAVINLLGYNLLYALPFLIVPVLYLLTGQESKPLLDRINNWIQSSGSVLMPLLLGLTGLVLLADAFTFLTTGTGLF